MNLSGAVTSKRYLKALVGSKTIEGWDDPRIPTIKGLKRRGYTRESILNFLGEIGVGKSESMVDIAMLEHSVRKDLKAKVPTIMAVFDPIKVVITNLPDKYVEHLDAVNNSENEDLGTRKIAFTKTIYIDRKDFSENPPKKYNRLIFGGEVRLKHAYFVKCNKVIKDENGNITELRCTYDPETKSGSGFKGRKVKGTIHWVSAESGISCEVRIFDELFTAVPSPESLFEKLNSNSLSVKSNAFIEEAVLGDGYEGRFQFIRYGYFIKDLKLSRENKLVFNRTVPLKSSYKG